MTSRPMTVLVVEDEPAMREVLDMRLRSWGYGILTVAALIVFTNTPKGPREAGATV